MNFPPIRGVVFDKDGTLVDFHGTWDPLILGLMEQLSAGDAELLERAALAIDFDLATRSTRPNSPVIAESNAGLVDRLAPVFGHRRGDIEFLAEVEKILIGNAAAGVTGVDGATAVLQGLAARGVPIGLATNDSEKSARAQLEHLGWGSYFVSVTGYDSGHGAKPGPGMVVANAAAMGVAVEQVAMVGDSHLDLVAARAAGAVAVLCGGRRDLVNEADVCITSLGELLDLVTD